MSMWTTLAVCTAYAGCMSGLLGFREEQPESSLRSFLELDRRDHERLERLQRISGDALEQVEDGLVFERSGLGVGASAVGARRRPCSCSMMGTVNARPVRIVGPAGDQARVSASGDVSEPCGFRALRVAYVHAPVAERLRTDCTLV